jgi:hypothetical protein
MDLTARYELALKDRRHLAKPYHFTASGCRTCTG